MEDRYLTCKYASKKGTCNPRVIEIRSWKMDQPPGVKPPHKFEQNVTYEIERICEKCDKYEPKEKKEKGA